MKGLPTIEANGKRWYLDLRLREMRNTENPHEVFELSPYGIRVAEACDKLRQDLQS